jgi:phosphatidylglycerophosphate synthase
VAFAFDALIVGALVYQASFLLDCMDGKVAAARQERNALGGWYDVIGDTVRLIACAVGLAIAVGDQSTLAAGLLMGYVSLRFGVMAIAAARPSDQQRDPAYLTLPARFGPVLRAAPRRSAPPGTTVDVEALVFTVGPLVGLPILAAGIAAAVELAHLSMYVVAAVSSTRPGRA